MSSCLYTRLRDGFNAERERCKNLGIEWDVADAMEVCQREVNAAHYSLQSENARLRAALEFYANSGGREYELDCGDTAKQALQPPEASEA